MISSAAANGNWKMKIETEIESRNQNGARRAAPSGTPTRALVVEYEDSMCELIKEALGAANIEAVTLARSAEAAGQFQEEKFDVILVDLGAPRENGNALVKQIRSSGFNRKTPIVMISGDQMPGALSEGFQAGASFFAYKPIDRARLMSLIRATQGTIEHEKRRFRRVAVRAKVRVKCGEKALEGETIDISMNGTLVRAAHTFPVGSPVEVSLYLLAGMHPVVGLGSIMRVMEGNQMGIQLDRLPAAESGRLQEYLLPLAAGEVSPRR
jgi:two-component system chemotaxis response regulator CheY